MTSAAPVLVPPMPPLARDDIGGLGVLAALRRNAFTAFPARCLDEPVVRLRMPGRALVLASSPDAIRHVLQTHPETFRRLPAGRRVLGPIAGRGLLTAEGDAWRRQRKAMAPAFTPRTVPVLARHVMTCTETAWSRLEAQGPRDDLDLLAEMQGLALEIAAATMFSLETGTFGAELRAMVSGYMAGIGKPSPSDFLLPAAIPTPLTWRRARFRTRWTALIGRIVARRRAQDAADPPPVGEPPRDLFDMIAAAYGPQADDLVEDETATMIVAGHETTALALFWACTLLAQAPDWQGAVAAEARGLDLSVDGAADALPNLLVTRAVVQEALRLYPPAFMTARLAIATSDVCGITVPKGAVVLMPFFLLHRDPTLWAAPERFDPARFLGREPERFAYLPFGAGPNTCIGAQLAMTEAVLVLARLLARNEIGLAPGTPPALPVGVLSTRPDHAPTFRLRRR